MEELTTYQKLLLKIDVQNPDMHYAIVRAKILAECIDENKCMTFNEYYDRYSELDPKDGQPE